MLFSRGLIPTLKEAPQDGSASLALLTRAAFVRRVGTGTYALLPLGVRVLRKIEALVRDEVERAGALEIAMPALVPSEVALDLERRFGDVLLRVAGRSGNEPYLAPAHDEMAIAIARREIRSYREMPRALYQIQAKFRDERRLGAGLLRAREFSTADAYSFDTDEAASRTTYETMRAAFGRIAERVGVACELVAADAGRGGAVESAELQAYVDSGEDLILACDACGYRANAEVAVGTVDAPTADAAPSPREEVHTPEKGSIDEVTAFLGAIKERMLKSLVYAAGDTVVMAVVRGDHDVNEIRLARALGVDRVALAGEADVRKATGAAVGFAGPVGFRGRILVDRAAAAVTNAITGANRTDHHFTGVNRGRDYDGEIADVRRASEGDRCAACGRGTLRGRRGVSVAHMSILGADAAERAQAFYADERQQQRPIVVGSFTMGVTRLMAVIVEQHRDAEGIRWPESIAPYQVHLVTVGKEAQVIETARRLYDALGALGVEVLWDDRDERPGVKFKDCDLLGVPLRVTVGAKALARGVVEVKARSETDPKNVEGIPVDDAARVIAERVALPLAARGPRC